jgi:predicted nucleic acid-binding protein
MRLLISDANILIDMECAGLLATLFRLPERFGIPDLLYHEEIEPDSPGLAAMGLEVMEVRGEFVAYAAELPVRHAEAVAGLRGTAPGHNDYLALALAKQEEATLLTGDASLRAVAELEQVAVMGTVGLLCAMVRQALLSVDGALLALEQMRQCRRRLPWEEAIRRLEAMR